MTATTATIPISAKVARTRAARTYAAERRARLSLLNLRARYEAGDRISAAAIGFASMTLWAAEQVHKEARERYQETLKAREAQPAPLRWQIKDLELWLKLNPGKGVPAT